MPYKVHASIEVIGSSGTGKRRRTVIVDGVTTTIVFSREPIYLDTLPAEIATDEHLIVKEISVEDVRLLGGEITTLSQPAATLTTSDDDTKPPLAPSTTSNNPPPLPPPAPTSTEPPPPPASDDTKPPPKSEDDLEHLTVLNLRTLCEMKGLPVRGAKAELIARLRKGS